MDNLFKKNKYQIFRFIISGLIASFLNFLVFNALYSIFKNIIIASFLGYATGLSLSFVLSKIWVFKDTAKKRIFKSFFIFCLIYILGGWEMSLIIFSLNQLALNYKVAWLFGASIGALNNYFGLKYFWFKK